MTLTGEALRIVDRGRNNRSVDPTDPPVTRQCYSCVGKQGGYQLLDNHRLDPGEL